LASRFIIEEDDEDVQKELKEAFRLYDKEGKGFILNVKENLLRLLIRAMNYDFKLP
jgi:Ca2+-binding EF-hand superfamily protein